MKRITILMIVMLLGVASLWARPGYSKPVDVLQPDGTTVTLLMRGDEFLNFMTTIDGYSVVKGDDGFYHYADKGADGQLTATSVIARNPAVRTAQEQSFLSGRAKMIAPEMTASQRELKRLAATLYAPVPQTVDGQRRAQIINSRINYNNFKGLVILVNFADRSFTLDNPQEFFQKLTSEAHYTDASLTHYPVPIEGSARDYFRDNSMGIFDPTFDVVGPVTISTNAADVGGSKASANTLAAMFKDALNQLNPTVDFSEYDLDNDGNIDLVYFIFAGYGSYVQGNNTGYIWPHASNWTGYASWLGLPKYDGKSFGRYACSVEIQDYEALASQHQYLDGIGTICHEFSHVLGLADHYDTNYEEGGSAPTAGTWDVMDGGADHNYGLTPAGYNCFERYQLGFCEPQLLEVAGDYTLQPFATGNESFMVKTKKNNEEFYIENRQKSGWDRFLPSHGLLVWRADTSRPQIWKDNEVNINPDAMYFELLCASGTSKTGANAPFPGSGNVIDLTDYSNEAWGSRKAAIDLFDITETDGVITFKAGKNLYERKVEDFEQTPVTSANATGVQGVFCNWDLVNAQIVNVADAGAGNGQHVAKLLRSGSISSSQAFENGIRTLKFIVKNGSSKVRFDLNISTDGGATWQAVQTKDIKKNEEERFSFINLPAGSRIQFAMRGASNSAVCYIDDIEVTFPDSGGSAIQTITAPDAAQPAVTYDLQGRRVDANYRGIVIRNGKKVVIK